MKITKSKLKQIIKEELERALSEDDVGAPIYPQDPLAMAQEAAGDPNITAPWLQTKPAEYYDDVRDSPVPEGWTVHELLTTIGPEHVAKVFAHLEEQSKHLPGNPDLAKGLISGEPEAVKHFSWFWAYEFETLDPSGIGGGEPLEEKAVSKKQQRFMGMVHAAQKGEIEDPSPEVKKVAKSMKKKSVEDFAGTKHKGLPEKKRKKKK